jgi:hypothetical protein
MALSVGASRFAVVAKANTSHTVLIESILFFLFFVIFRVKWFLDDITELKVFITVKNSKHIRDNLSQIPNEKNISIFFLPFVVFSWVSWVLSAFFVPDYMSIAYICLLLAIISGTCGGSIYYRARSDCHACFILFNFMYMFLIILLWIMQGLIPLLSIYSTLFLVLLGDAMSFRSFNSMIIEKSKDRSECCSPRSIY